MRVQAEVASPVYPGLQVQMGLWFLTEHWAFLPQVPGQGSRHFFWTQAKWLGHSVLIRHSGLQPTYGSPMWSLIHLQAPALSLAEHSALAPQGEGLQGSTGSGLVMTSGRREQPEKGSPVYLVGQVQMALWLTAVHRALYPQAPTQGSEHFCWIQALLLGHSALRTHSGRQLGGAPMKPGRQVQDS